MFDSVPFRGLQLTSDDQMRPNSQRGFTPRRFASPAQTRRLSCGKGGYIAYQTAVSPGEFEINDMFPTGSNGDYDVTVKKPTAANSIFIIALLFAADSAAHRTGKIQRDRG
ncbi:fimbria/pilus outer membrane usher protein [Salmonella enterica subsp. enterica]|nr:fimbria/pilus outer membrane usher protein [Salmonella enterica subsp. enterica]